MWSHQLSKHIKPILKSCNKKSILTKLHSYIITTGLQNTSAQLLAAYAGLGDLVTARKVFDIMPHRAVDAWNAMLIAYSRKESSDDVLTIYRMMVNSRVALDSSSYTVTIKACTRLLDFETGEEVRRKAVESGYGDDVFVGSALVNMFVKCGKMNEAMTVFRNMGRRDIVSWTSMITGFSQNGFPREAIKLYREMANKGLEGDDVVMLGLIQACASLGALRLGLSVHGFMIRREIPMSVMVMTSLVDMYAKVGYLDIAFRVFRGMRYKNVVSWGALISGYAQNGFAGEALGLLVDMQSDGVEPDSVSLVSALLACSQVGYLKLGKSIHGYIVRRLDFGTILGTAVIDMYSKCGELSSARYLFHRIGFKDVVSWNAIITSYGVHGLGREALLLFIQMIETNLIPNDATFASLLSALSHSGLVEEGKYWFDMMIGKYKIQPQEKHYACVVDLLARAGRVSEACKLIESVTSEVRLALWVALLSGCCNHENLIIGEMAAKKILELNPDDLGVYTLVSNFFALARKWDEVAGVRKMMKSSGKRKVPGYSLVEVNGELHAFLMEDKSHCQYEDVLQVLDILAYEMRASESSRH